MLLLFCWNLLFLSVNPCCFLHWNCFNASRDYDFTIDSQKFKQQIHANRCGNVFQDLKKKHFVPCIGTVNQLQGQMMATWQENVTIDSSQDLMECFSALLSLHFILFPCLTTFFCLLIFSFSLGFIPSLSDPALFNAWPPNSSTPRCTSPSFLCLADPLHFSVVHRSTLIKSPL